jgi:allantoinase
MTKISVLLTVMFEAWPQGKAPPYGPMASPLREGTTDLQGISWADYGGRTGIWRLMRLFDDYGVKATVCANAHALERFPEAARELAKRGHEIAGHSYTQDVFMPYLSMEEERALIRRCTQIIESSAGVRPVGWASPRMTPTLHTARLLAEEGFLWHGDYHDADLPYKVKTEAGEIVALPHSDFTDNRVLRGSPRDFHGVYKDTFDYLYAREPGGVLNLTVHAHFGARPPLAAMIDELLRYMSRYPAVRFARHDEIAREVLASR